MSGASTVLGVLMGRRNSRALSGAATRQSMTRRAEQRAATAEAKAGGKADDLARLEADLTAAVSDVTTAWEAKAAEVESVEVGLEKTDVTVEAPVVVWIPV